MKDLYLANIDGNPNWVSPMDIQYDGNGNSILVGGVQLLDQMIVKALMTQFSTDTLAPLYGGSFSSMIGVKLDQATSAILMVSETERIVNRVAKITQNNNFTPDQQIAGLNDILISNPNGPTSTTLTIQIQTQSGSSVTLAAPVKTYQS